MKRIVILGIFLMVFITPLKVNACEPAFPDEGIKITIDDINVDLDSDNDLTFDMLVKKQEVPYEYLLDTRNSNYYSEFGHISGILSNPYLEYDQEWISYAAYVQVKWTDTYVDNYLFGAHIYNYTFQFEEWFSTIKIVVFDDDGNVLSTSQEFDVFEVTQNNENQDPSRKVIVYNSTDNEFSLMTSTNDWDSINNACSGLYSTGGFMMYMFLLMVAGIIMLVGEPIIVSVVTRSRKTTTSIGYYNLLFSVLPLLFYFNFVLQSGLLLVPLILASILSIIKHVVQKRRDEYFSYISIGFSIIYIFIFVYIFISL